MANFDELLPKIQAWDVEEEEILINKIKQMTEDYQQKCSDLSINLNNMTRNLHLIEVDFFNTLNGLKEISGKKFIEHVIDTEDIKPEEEDNEDKKDISDENELNFSSVNSIVQRGLDFIAFRDQQKSQNKSNVEDDSVSMNSKVMDNNLMKNNRGLKLPMLIGTKDFNDNDYIGLVIDDDEEEEENFDNELRNEQGVVVPKESGAQGEEVISDLNENNNNNNIDNVNNNINNNQNISNINNNPEEFHNKIQQQMGKPIKSQNILEPENEKNEGGKELINPAMESMQVDNNLSEGLGGMLRNTKTQINPQLQLPKMINNNQVNNINTMNQTVMINEKKKPPIGGKFSLSNFLSNDMFGDDDDEDDTSGLFGRPMKKGISMSTIQNNNNIQLNNNISNNQNILSNNNQVIPGTDIQIQNNNNLNNSLQQQSEQPYYEKNEKIPLNQRMEMVPNPLLLMKQNNMNNQQMQPQIEEKKGEFMDNKVEEKDDDDNLNDFQKRKKKLEKLLKPNQRSPIMMNPMIKEENIAQNEIINKEQDINMNNNMNMNMNNNMNINNNMNNNLNNEIINNNINQNNQFNNNQTIKPMTQREIENKRKLENAKSKINFIFGDDDEDEDDLFSKKKPLNKDKIEEKSQNLQERLNQITSSYPTNVNNNVNKKMNDLFNNGSSNNNTNNIFQNNNTNTNIFQNNNLNNIFQNNNANTNILQNNNNNIINNNQFNNNNSNENKNNIKKKKFFLDEDDDEDFNYKIQSKNMNQNINNQNNQNINNQNMNNILNNQPINKNEPKVIMPKPMNQFSNIQQEPRMVMPKPEVKKPSIFEEIEEKPKIEPKLMIQNQIENQPKVENKKAKMFLFDDNDTNQNQNKVNTNIVNNNVNSQIKAPTSLFDGIDVPKPEKKEEKKKVPNFFFEEKRCKTKCNR